MLDRGEWATADLMVAAELEMKMCGGGRQFAESFLVRTFGLLIPSQLVRIECDAIDRLYQAGRSARESEVARSKRAQLGTKCCSLPTFVAAARWRLIRRRLGA